MAFKSIEDMLHGLPQKHRERLRVVKQGVQLRILREQKELLKRGVFVYLVSYFHTSVILGKFNSFHSNTPHSSLLSIDSKGASKIDSSSSACRESIGDLRVKTQFPAAGAR